MVFPTMDFDKAQTLKHHENIQKIVSEYDQEIPKSQTADYPMAQTSNFMNLEYILFDVSQVLFFIIFNLSIDKEIVLFFSKIKQLLC